MDRRYLGFMVSSATALVKFLCDIGKNLVKKTRSGNLKAPDVGNNIWQHIRKQGEYKIVRTNQLNLARALIG